MVGDVVDLMLTLSVASTGDDRVGNRWSSTSNGDDRVDNLK